MILPSITGRQVPRPGPAPSSSGRGTSCPVVPRGCSSRGHCQDCPPRPPPTLNSPCPPLLSRSGVSPFEAGRVSVSIHNDCGAREDPTHLVPPVSLPPHHTKAATSFCWLVESGSQREADPPCPGLQTSGTSCRVPQKHCLPQGAEPSSPQSPSGRTEGTKVLVVPWGMASGATSTTPKCPSCGEHSTEFILRCGTLLSSHRLQVLS